jgi:hypothetical protein
VYPKILSFQFAAAALLLVACSGADGRPPPMEGATDSPSTTTEEPTLSGSVCNDGATTACTAPLGYATGGYIMCVAGTKACSAGKWTACASDVTFVSFSPWEPEDVGCTWPPHACATEGAVSTCRKELPSTGSTANCTDITEVCYGGFWLPCAP